MSQIEKIEKLQNFAQESISWRLEADFEAQMLSRSRPKHSQVTRRAAQLLEE